MMRHKWFQAVPLTVVLVAFISSRVVFWQAGGTFDSRPLEHFWQYLDIELLQHNLLESLWYLHSQPPLYNLFLGGVLQLFPADTTLAFQVGYFCMGVALAVLLYLLLHCLGLPVWAAVGLTVVFVISPSTIMYEHWLYSTYPELVLFCGAALFLHRFATRWRVVDGALFFSLLAGLALLRSTYHLLWMLSFGGLLLLVQRQQWRQIALAAALPVLLVGLLYAKNMYFFGSPTTSTWMGMSLWRMAEPGLANHGDAQALLESGQFHPIVSQPPFGEPHIYEGLVAEPPITGIPALDNERRANGPANFNYYGYIGISGHYRAAALQMLRAYPEVYGTSVERAWYFFFVPPSELPWFYENGNRAALEPLDRFYNQVVYGQPVYPVAPAYWDRQEEFQGLLLIAGYVLALLYGLVESVRLLIGKTADRARSLTVMFMWLNVGFVSLASNLLEFGENNRYRFPVDPFIWVILALLVLSLVREMRRVFATPSSSAEPSRQ